MPKFYVIHGSVGLPDEKSAGLGDSLELSQEQAAALISSGMIADEETFSGLRKMAEGALEAGNIERLDKQGQKLALGLRAAGKLSVKSEPKTKSEAKK